MVRSAPGARERAELAEVTLQVTPNRARECVAASMQARVRALEAEVKDLKATAGEDDEDGCSFSEMRGVHAALEVLAHFPRGSTATTSASWLRGHSG